jgi:hypothetical protein
MDWEECKDKKFVKETTSDQSLINSLIKSSNAKIESNNRLELDDITSNTKLGIVYDALREVLEALSIKNGFKIYNHECFTAFLYEILKDSLSSYDFDRFRKIRNQINYYGREIELNEAKILIKDIIK